MISLAVAHRKMMKQIISSVEKMFWTDYKTETTKHLERSRWMEKADYK